MPEDDNTKLLPRVLTIAGSDSSSGSGIQADLRILSRAGVIPYSVVTAVTAQSRDGFVSSHPVPPQALEAQLEAVMKDGVPAATKIGMLGSADAIGIVCEAIDRWDLKNVVLDPVMESSSLGKLLGSSAQDGDDDGPENASGLEALERLKRNLLPRVTLVTPNLNEAEALVGYEVQNEATMRSAAATLVNELGVYAALVKGGHLPSGEEVFDILRDGNGVTKLTGGKFPASGGQRVPELGGNVGRGRASGRDSVSGPRGTGCVLSSSIAVHLARGDDLETSVRKARGFLRILVESASEGPVPWLLATGDGFYIEELLDI